MGQLIVPASGLVYVDTNAVIYHVEQLEPHYSAALPLWEAVDAGLAQVVTSELTLLEVLVKPLRDGNQQLVHLFEQVLYHTTGITTAPIDRTILEQAARLRATCQIKTPDAIHAATASRNSSDSVGGW